MTRPRKYCEGGCYKAWYLDTWNGDVDWIKQNGYVCGDCVKRKNDNRNRQGMLFR